MSLRQLNLATRPFRNERLPALLIALGFTVVGVATLKHALVARRLLPSQTSGLTRHVDDLEAERGRLRAEVARLRAPRPDPAVVARWTRVAELVDMRAFSWSQLFAVLEQSLPAGVRIVSIAPHVERNKPMVVDLAVMTRNDEDALALIDHLAGRPEFANVLPHSRAPQTDGVTMNLTAEYRPQALLPVAAPSPAPSSSPVPSPLPSAAVSAPPAGGMALPTPGPAAAAGRAAREATP